MLFMEHKCNWKYFINIGSVCNFKFVLNTSSTFGLKFRKFNNVSFHAYVSLTLHPHKSYLRIYVKEGTIEYLQMVQDAEQIWIPSFKIKNKRCLIPRWRWIVIYSFIKGIPIESKLKGITAYCVCHAPIYFHLPSQVLILMFIFRFIERKSKFLIKKNKVIFIHSFWNERLHILTLVKNVFSGNQVIFF